MKHSAEMRRCMIDLDVDAMQRLDAHLNPHLASMSKKDTLKSMHIARTSMKTIPFKLRAYSHSWLTNQGYPSQLPDELKPAAEREYPKISEAVGIGSLKRAPHTLLVRQVMSDKVCELYADKRTEPEFVKAQMMEARAKEMKKLFGITS
jgi:hypothetical protein